MAYHLHKDDKNKRRYYILNNDREGEQQYIYIHLGNALTDLRTMMEKSHETEVLDLLDFDQKAADKWTLDDVSELNIAMQDGVRWSITCCDGETR